MFFLPAVFAFFFVACFFVTVTLHFSVFPFTLAVTTAFPAFLPVTLPFALTVATDFFEDFHFTFFFVPRTFNVTDFPTAIFAVFLFSLIADAASATPLYNVLPANTAAINNAMAFLFLYCFIIILHSVILSLLTVNSPR